MRSRTARSKSSLSIVPKIRASPAFRETGKLRAHICPRSINQAQRWKRFAVWIFTLLIWSVNCWVVSLFRWTENPFNGRIDIEERQENRNALDDGTSEF